MKFILANMEKKWAENNDTAVIYFFYDGPTPPSGLFDAFLAIPSAINTIATSTYAKLISTYDGSADVGR